MRINHNVPRVARIRTKKMNARQRTKVVKIELTHLEILEKNKKEWNMKQKKDKKIKKHTKPPRVSILSERENASRIWKAL